MTTCDKCEKWIESVFFYFFIFIFILFLENGTIFCLISPLFVKNQDFGLISREFPVASFRLRFKKKKLDSIICCYLVVIKVKFVVNALLGRPFGRFAFYYNGIFTVYTFVEVVLGERGCDVPIVASQSVFVKQHFRRRWKVICPQTTLNVAVKRRRRLYRLFKVLVNPLTSERLNTELHKRTFGWFLLTNKKTRLAGGMLISGVSGWSVRDINK